MIPFSVIQYHASKHKVSLDQAYELFDKLEQFLFEVSNNQTTVPSKDVDDVWHTFILHTKLYQEYCLNMMGCFIHHNPHLPNSMKNCDAGESARALALCNGEDDDEKPPCDSSLKKFSLLADCKGACGGETACDAQYTRNLTHLK